MTIPALDVSRLLRGAGLTPRKGLGQNFLTDPAVLDKVVEAAGVTRDDAVLEIGPGLGRPDASPGTGCPTRCGGRN